MGKKKAARGRQSEKTLNIVRKEKSERKKSDFKLFFFQHRERFKWFLFSVCFGVFGSLIPHPRRCSTLQDAAPRRDCCSKAERRKNLFSLPIKHLKASMNVYRWSGEPCSRAQGNKKITVFNNFIIHYYYLFYIQSPLCQPLRRRENVLKSCG